MYNHSTFMGYILGISAYYHDSAACLLKHGVPIAAAQEERFTRIRHDAKFPRNAVQYCLAEAKIKASDLECVIFYDKPLLTFDRLLETYLAFAPKGIRSFMAAIPIWLHEKLFLKKVIQRELQQNFGWSAKQTLLFSEHHESHAASAYYPSPFKEAAVLCMDGVGEWATTSAWLGTGNQLKPLWEIRFPHSLGLLYSAFTYYTGFKVNSGEYKIMGLAPYGEPKYVDKILTNLMDLKEDGTFCLNLDYFDYCTGLRMTNRKFEELFGGPARKSESTLTQKEMDLARSIQVVTEEVVLRLAKKIHEETGMDNLCMAGGVALNCVANGRLLREGPFKKIWIQPAAGDAGGAVGCAFVAEHKFYGRERKEPKDLKDGLDGMSGSYLGPKFTNDEIEKFLNQQGAPYQKLEDPSLFETLGDELVSGKIIGWFNGRMEFGPRALGARSIIGDARSEKMQSILNLKIKFRESFRPFAPAILKERVQDYFEMEEESPYMLLVAPIQPKHRKPLSDVQGKLWGIDLLNVPKSDIPAVTHVDYSARIQTVHQETNSRFYRMIQAFEKKSGCPVVVNTSFNVRGEPIVCTPEDAYRCFMRTEMDILVLENCMLKKSEQPQFSDSADWQKEFQLD